jgi:tetratricopeptide (TPR) repeat protein
MICVGHLEMRTLTLRFATAFGICLLAALNGAAQRDRETYNVGPQTFEVSGQVKIADSDQSAQNINVRLERFSGGIVDQMMTDSRGRFRFTNLPRGYYKVVINSPGFRPAQQDADLQVVFKAYLLFELVSDPLKSNSGVASVVDVLDVRVPLSARGEFERGRSELAKKNTAEGITHLENAISKYPEFFEARLVLATAFMDLRQWAKAEASLSQALNLRTDDATALLALGEVHWRQKNYPEAEKLLLEGLKVDKKSWHGYFTLARMYWEQGDIAKAAPAIGKTLQLKPDFAPGHLLAGNVLLRVSQRERALMEYQEYLRLEPKGEFAAQTRELIEKLNKEIAASKN